MGLTQGLSREWQGGGGVCVAWPQNLLMPGALEAPGELR